MDNDKVSLCASPEVKRHRMENSDDNQAICAGSKISDGGLDNAQSLPYRNGEVTIWGIRMLKEFEMFDVESGKEKKNLNLKFTIGEVLSIILNQTKHIIVFDLCLYFWLRFMAMM